MMFGMGAPMGPPQEIIDDLPPGVSMPAVLDMWSAAYEQGYKGYERRVLTENPELQPVYDHGWGQGSKHRAVNDEAGSGPQQQTESGMEGNSGDGEDPATGWRLRVYGDDHVNVYFDAEPEMAREPKTEDPTYWLSGTRAGLKRGVLVSMRNTQLFALEELAPARGEGKGSGN